MHLFMLTFVHLFIYTYMRTYVYINIDIFVLTFCIPIYIYTHLHSVLNNNYFLKIHKIILDLFINRVV